MPARPPDALVLRAATPDDADRLARAVVEGMAEYEAFAPAGWAPPPPEPEADHLRELLADPAVWCMLAEVEGDLAGQITVLPAARAARPVADPALAHLRTLFVRRDLWGTGVASALHTAAVEAAGERGYQALRLFTPTGQARARRFYEREGWRPVGEAFHDPGPNLVLLEYRLRLGA